MTSYVPDVDVGDAAPLRLALVVILESTEAHAGNIVGAVSCKQKQRKCVGEIQKQRRYQASMRSSTGSE